MTGLDDSALCRPEAKNTRADIFGFDIDDFSKVSIGRCKIIQGGMSSRDDLARFVRAIARPIDILIGSHASHHKQIAFGYLFRYMRRSRPTTTT
jgi:hypothetical protein